MKKVLFIDRDGTLVLEPPVDYQLDSLEKLEFYPKVMRNLGFIRSKLDFEFAMVTNQDGLGTASFPEETFWPAHNLMMKTLEGEGITFDEIFIDRSMPEDMAIIRSTILPEVSLSVTVRRMWNWLRIWDAGLFICRMILHC